MLWLFSPAFVAKNKSIERKCQAIWAKLRYRSPAAVLSSPRNHQFHELIENICELILNILEIKLDTRKKKNRSMKRMKRILCWIEFEMDTQSVL